MDNQREADDEEDHFYAPTTDEREKALGQKENPETFRVSGKKAGAEGVGFEPTEQETPLSGLANRRTRPTMRPFQMRARSSHFRRKRQSFRFDAGCQRGDSNPHERTLTTP